MVSIERRAVLSLAGESNVSGLSRLISNAPVRERRVDDIVGIQDEECPPHFPLRFAKSPTIEIGKSLY